MLRMHWPYLVVTLAYCAGIFYLSSQPQLPDPTPPWFEFEGMDKVAHAIVYGGLAFVVSIGLWRANPGIRRPLHFGAPVAFALVYGLTDEIHQIFVPNRTFEWLDLLADAFGATIIQGVACPILWRETSASARAEATFPPATDIDPSKGTETTK